MDAGLSRLIQQAGDRFCRELAIKRRQPVTVDLVKRIYCVLHPEEGDVKTVKYRKDIPQHRLYFHEYTPPDKIAYKLRQIIERDLAEGTYSQRHFAGAPGDAAHHAAGAIDAAKIRTRFPPEPNGYLHIGHAKSITLNFGLAAEYGGVCHMRFDDTNPEKEEQEYVDSILDAVRWLGFDWNLGGVSHLYYASNYFDFMYRAAEALINAGLAYVDEQSADEIRHTRGDFNHAGVDSPLVWASLIVLSVLGMVLYGAVVLAEEQTAGRGRAGRAWAPRSPSRSRGGRHRSQVR